MEWSSEQSQFIESLRGATSFILPEAPEEMKTLARKINIGNVKARGYKTYIGLDFCEKSMVKLNIPIPIRKEGDIFVVVELPSKDGDIRYQFPKFGVCCMNGKIVAIEKSIRKECLMYNQCSVCFKPFDPSALDVSGPYEE